MSLRDHIAVVGDERKKSPVSKKGVRLDVHLVDSDGELSPPVTMAFDLFPDMSIRNTEAGVWKNLEGIAKYYVIMMSGRPFVGGALTRPFTLTSADTTTIEPKGIKIFIKDHPGSHKMGLRKLLSQLNYLTEGP